MRNVFSAADIWLPKTVDCTWPVVACDQFSSQPSKWVEMDAFVGQKPSTLRLVFPEAFLEDADAESRIKAIHGSMQSYLEQGILEPHPNCFVYVRRTLPDGRVRQGLVGKVDLQAYSYVPGERCTVRPTERTIPSRLPARVHIRQGAALELPHVLALLDDGACSVIEPLEHQSLPLLYDVPLWGGAGSAAGFLAEGEQAAALSQKLDAVFARCGDIAMTVGDGNHSLAAAKLYYNNLRDTMSEDAWNTHPARWALVELENLHSPSLDFAPIHRLVLNTTPNALLDAIGTQCTIEYTTTLAMPQHSTQKDGWQIAFVCEDKYGTLTFHGSEEATAVGALQKVLEAFAAKTDARLDYIHGDKDLIQLAKTKGCMGFLVPALDKSDLFHAVEQGGVLPLKAFSLGQALEKRFYIESRKII